MPAIQTNVNANGQRSVYKTGKKHFFSPHLCWSLKYFLHTVGTNIFSLLPQTQILQILIVL